MNILVTGAAGFIGKHFVYHASNFLTQAQLVCVDKLTYAADPKTVQFLKKKQIPFYSYDINDSLALSHHIVYHNIDLIVNFAAETHVDNSINDVTPFIETNIFGVNSILEAVKKTNTKLLHISTDEVYGPASETHFIEEDKLQPKNPYAATKASAELLINAHENTYATKSWILRPTNNFGERQNTEKFIPKYIDCYKSKKPFPVYGNGQQKREWLYVKDTAKIIFEVCNLITNNVEVPSILNIGSPNSSFTNMEMCKNLFGKLNPEGSLDDFLKTINFVNDRPGHDVKYAINSDKLSTLMPKLSFTSLDNALNSIITSAIT